MSSRKGYQRGTCGWYGGWGDHRPGRQDRPVTASFWQHLPDSCPGAARGPDPCAAAVGEPGDRWAPSHSPGLQPPRPGHHGPPGPPRSPSSVAGSSSATWQLEVSRTEPQASSPPSASPWQLPWLVGPLPVPLFMATSPLKPSYLPSPGTAPPSAHLLSTQATWVQPPWEQRPGGSCMPRTGLRSPTASW